MPVIAHIVLRGCTTEEYDALRTAVGWLDTPPEGGLGHVTWWEGEDCHNIDAWESEEACNAFAEQQLAPALAAAGMPMPEVTFHAAHEVYLLHGRTFAPTAGRTASGTSILAGGYEAFARGDIPAVLELLDPEIEWTSPSTTPFGGRYVGPEQVAEFFAKLPEFFSELEVVPEQMFEQGSTVVALGRDRGRTHNGTAFDSLFCHRYEMRDGRILRFDEAYDTAQVAAAIESAAPRAVSAQDVPGQAGPAQAAAATEAASAG